MATESTPMVIDNEFDIETYIGNYNSRARVSRLLFIAEQSTGTRKELDALKLAADILKQGIDVRAYREVIDKIGGRLGTSYKTDDSWIDRIENQNRLRQEELISQFQAFMAKSAKEGIRIACNDLAVFYYDTGRLQRTRIFESKVCCFHGLKELEGKKYYLAANQFIEIHPEISDSFNDVATAQDMASYGALCALASFNRDELKANVLSNVNFKELMEYSPELKECVRDFQKSDYSSCLSRLERLKPMLMMDMYLGPHLHEIYSLIRQRALIQYTVPFSSISLHSMAEALNVSIQDVERELVSLIMKDQIVARVDSENKILYAQKGEARSKTFQNARSMTKTYLQDHKGLLIRLSLIKYELIQKQPASAERKSKRNDQYGIGGSQTLTPDDIISRLL
eukprot:g5550.t1